VREMLLATLALCLGVSACAQRVWNKPGATQQDFATDSYACERDARQSGYFGGGLVTYERLPEVFRTAVIWDSSNARTTQSSLFPW
jgi:hypothetical protein